MSIVSDLVKDYIINNYNIETSSILQQSLLLLNEFGIFDNLNPDQPPDYEIAFNVGTDFQAWSAEQISDSVLDDILYKLNTDSESADHEMVNMEVRAYIEKMMCWVMFQHGIILKQEEATLYDKYWFLYFLNILKDVEDVLTIHNIIESDEDGVEKLSKLVPMFTMLTEMDVYRLVDNISIEFFDTLSSYLKQIIVESDKNNENLINKKSPEQIKILNNLKQFKLFIPTLKIEGFPIGIEKVESGIRIGLSIENYLEYIFMIADPSKPKTTALNIMSVILMSVEGYNNVKAVFSSISNRIFQDDLNTIIKIDSEIGFYITSFENFKGRNNV